MAENIKGIDVRSTQREVITTLTTPYSSKGNIDLIQNRLN